MPRHPVVDDKVYQIKRIFNKGCEDEQESIRYYWAQNEEQAQEFYEQRLRDNGWIYNEKDDNWETTGWWFMVQIFFVSPFNQIDVENGQDVEITYKIK